MKKIFIAPAVQVIKMEMRVNIMGASNCNPQSVTPGNEKGVGEQLSRSIGISSSQPAKILDF